ncbi:MAG: DUF4435 domain-containing protein [Candidatus Thiodiazotropha taylori]|nr:DUF4435 domain-containing protein [Candidatus Thiodiazotropha taylori]
MIPERNEKGRYAKSVFYHDVNDIDIYVEDTGKGSEKLYRNLFYRVFEAGAKIYKVFPLGCRNSVIERCEKDNSETGRISLYVVDGDLALLSDHSYECERLLVLDRYSIENYLIDSEAIVDLLFEEDLEKDRDELDRSFDYLGWVTANEELLCNLFVVYSIAYRVAPDMQTVQYRVNQLVNNNKGEACASKVGARIKEIEDILIDRIGADSYQKEKERSLSLINTGSTNQLIKYVSGKDYLMPLLLMRMRRLVKFRAENKILKQRLSLKCDVQGLKDKNIIKEITRSFSRTESITDAQLAAS